MIPRPRHTALRAVLQVLILTTPSVAFGQSGSRTLLDLQVSRDGVTWTDATQLSGTDPVTVQVRATVTFMNTAGTARPIGLASLSFQPTVSSWIAGSDSVLPFATTGTNNSGGAVLDVAGMNAPYGRIVPFAFTGPATSNPYFVHEQQIDGVSSARIALASADLWPSAATTSASSAEGITCEQRAYLNVTDSDPYFAAATRQVVVFKFAISLDPSRGPRTLRIDAPEMGLSRNWQTGAPEASWYSSLTDTYGRTKAPIDVHGAAIVVIPQGSVFVQGLLGMCAIATRRRRSC